MNLLKKTIVSLHQKGPNETARRVRDYFLRPKEVKKLPNFLVEVATTCNLRCPMCARTVNVEKKNWKNSVMKLEVFKSIAANLPEVGKLSLHASGEPTMNPDLLAIIQYARELGKIHRIHIVSNALFRDADYYDEVFDAGLTTLTISIDSLDQGIADILRTGTDVEKLKANVRNILARHLDKVNINMVIGPANLNDVEHTLVKLDGIVGEVSKEGQKLTVKLIKYADFGSDKYLMGPGGAETLAMLLKKNEGHFEYLHLRDAFSTLPRWTDCTWPINAHGVYIDGTLVPCCNSINSSIPGEREAFGFSNLLEQHYSEIMQSAQVHKFYDDFKREKPEFCNGCPRLEGSRSSISEIPVMTTPRL
jgi:MoaA/NifB/PqqE/SkfB family radical SAM enzyme